jgi:hypothetical protein
VVAVVALREAVELAEHHQLFQEARAGPEELTTVEVAVAVLAFWVLARQVRLALALREAMGATAAMVAVVVVVKAKEASLMAPAEPAALAFSISTTKG